MARFYGDVQGNRGEATRMGTPSSGISAHIRGWDVGINVQCYVDDDGFDVCEAYPTGGSRNPSVDYKRRPLRVRGGKKRRKA